jgi:multiple sugar transport system substrate-binding protein
MRKAPFLLLLLASMVVACSQSTASQPASGSGPTASAAPAPSEGAPQPVTITFASWAAAEDSQRAQIEKAIADFEAANPNIKVTSVPIPFSDIENQLGTMAAANNSPDVSQLTNSLVPSLQAGNLLAPLGTYDPGLLEQFVPSMLEVGSVGGTLYALPWDIGPSALWYNRDLMQKAGLDPNSPPKTLDEMMADMVQAKAKIPDVVGFGQDTTIRTFGLDQNWPVMLAFGVKADANGIPQANTPEMTAYLSWMKTLIDKGLTLPGKKCGEFRPIAAQGNLLFGWDGPYFKSLVQDVNNDITDAQWYASWGVTSLPSGADGKHYAIPDDDYLVMSDSSKNKDASWKFMAFLATSETAVRDYTLPFGALPPLASAASTIKELDNPIAKSFYQDVLPAYVQPPYYGRNYSQIATAIMTNVQKVFASSDSPATIAAAMADELSQVGQ